MAYSQKSLTAIAKNITDGFYNFLINKDLEKKNTSSDEQKINTYNALYKLVYDYVDNYFQKNTFTTNDNLKKQLKIVVQNLTNILVDKIFVNPDSDSCSTVCNLCNTGNQDTASVINACLECLVCNA